MLHFFMPQFIKNELFSIHIDNSIMFRPQSISQFDLTDFVIIFVCKS